MRERAKSPSLRSYRKLRPLVPRSYRTAVGVQMEVQHPSGNGRWFHTTGYSISTLATLLGRTAATLHKWIREGLIPAPVYIESSKRYNVYIQEEANMLLHIMRQHDAHFSYYGHTCTHTRRRIAAQMDSIRSTVY